MWSGEDVKWSGEDVKWGGRGGQCRNNCLNPAQGSCFV